MSHVLTIAGREIRERRMVFLAAAFIAVMPFLFALLPSAERFGRAARIAATGGILAVCWTVALAIVLGLTAMSTELAQQRLSFYLTKPIGAASLWLGKLGAALLILFSTMAIILVPSLAVGWDSWQTAWNLELNVVLALAVGVSTAALLLFHFLGTAVRSRSPLIALDLLLFAVLAGTAWLLINSLLVRLSLDNAKLVALGIAGGFLLAVIPAGIWQVSRGRSDIRKSHAALSKFLWPAALLVLLLAGGAVGWILSADPSDLLFPEAGQAPQGNWAWLSGTAKNRGDYKPTFLIDASTGRHFTLPGFRFQSEFSRDGQSLVWSRVSRQSAELMVTRLGDGIRHLPTGVSATWIPAVVLSDDGTRVAVIDSASTLSVVEVDTQRILASVKLKGTERWESRRHRLFFADNDTVRIYDGPQSGGPAMQPLTLRAHEFHVTSRSLTTTGELTTVAKALTLIADSSGSRLLVSPVGGEGSLLVDARTLATIATLPVKPTWVGSFILANGNVVIADHSRHVLHVFDRDGRKLREIAPGAGDRYWIESEIAPSSVLVVSPSQRLAFVVDCDRGVVKQLEKGLVPASSARFGADPRIDAPGGPRRLLAGDANRVLWRWDPMTGAKTRL